MRLYYFRNDGNDEYYIGSADAMRRNLEKRIEVVVPVEDPSLKLDLRKTLDIQFQDNGNSWIMQEDGRYERSVLDPEKKGKTCQEILIEIAGEASKGCQQDQTDSIPG